MLDTAERKDYDWPTLIEEGAAELLIIMNKKEFITWIESLPEDFEVHPINISEDQGEESSLTSDFEATGTTYQAVYKKNVRTNMKLDITFEGEVSGEFHRDNFGVEHWANIRRIK